MNDIDATDFAKIALARLGGKVQKDHVPLTVINPAALFGVPVPPRRWLVPDWVPIGSTTINYGNGGVGKTLLTQMLGTSSVSGMPWCGLAVERCRVFALFCEDDPDELHRRQDAINASYGLNFGDLEGFRWASGVEEDNVLADFDRDGNMTLTDRYRDLETQVEAFGAKLVILDTAADLFGGNENDRRQVRQFIGHALNGMARRLEAAVLLNAHPSRNGMGPGGDGDGGSTAWSNTARSRWSLTRPDAEDEGEVDPHERILTRRKANYSSIGDSIRLRWHKGVLVAPETGEARFTSGSRRADCEALFLTFLDRADEQGRALSHSRNAANYAPKVFSKAPDRQGFQRRNFENALEALFAARAIEVRNYGKPSDDTRKIARATLFNPETNEGATVGDGSEKAQ